MIFKTQKLIIHLLFDEHLQIPCKIKITRNTNQHCTIFSALILEISVATASPYSLWSEREEGIKGTKATKLTFVKGDRRAKKRRVTSASLIKIKNRGSLVSAIHQFITTQYIYKYTLLHV